MFLWCCFGISIDINCNFGSHFVGGSSCPSVHPFLSGPFSHLSRCFAAKELKDLWTERISHPPSSEMFMMVIGSSGLDVVGDLDQQYVQTPQKRKCPGKQKTGSPDTPPNKTTCPKRVNACKPAAFGVPNPNSDSKLVKPSKSSNSSQKNLPEDAEISAGPDSCEGEGEGEKQGLKRRKRANHKRQAKEKTQTDTEKRMKAVQTYLSRLDIKWSSFRKVHSRHNHKYHKQSIL